MFQKLLVFAFVALIGNSLFAQRNMKDSVIGTPWVAVHYGANWTSGDLADRYGFLNHIGAVAGYKTSKNWFWGLDGNFIFGNQVRMTGIFDNLVDSYGNVTDVNGDIGKILVFARGFNVNFAVGKVIPVFRANRNSGLFIHAGAGYLLHKMRVETQDQVIPSLELDYRKGYDRLTIGLATHQFVGYAFLSNRGAINFYGGFYAQQGFTKNQRDIFFDQPTVAVSKELRSDIQMGLKLGWFIPIYKRQPKDFYFN
ncbi:MAG: hypothetical protein E6Q37_06950 [Crocinitomicaceae bacterium]|nr:MAG: hypothetical protein E6Q37_06950 [Crocinitomicaceae bacterium]